MANKSDDTEEAKVTGTADIQAALEGTLEPTGDDEDQNDEGNDDQGDDDQSDDSEEDDSKDDAEDGSDAKDDDSEEDDDSGDDDKEDKSDESKGERRFTQFKGDGSEDAYLKNLEDGYANSSQEGIRLNTELTTANRRLAAIDRAIQADPALAETLQKAMGKTDQQSGPTKDKNRDPFLRNSEREWREKSEQEAKEFVDANPEVLSDPKINADVKKLMAKFSEIELEENDRLMSAGEAMTKAYAYLGLEVKSKQKTEVASEAKKIAAPTRPQPAKKKASTSSNDFTDLQLKLAGKMGVSKETLSKYNK